jgi:hypothetical protein
MPIGMLVVQPGKQIAMPVVLTETLIVKLAVRPVMRSERSVDNLLVGLEVRVLE